MEIIADLRYVVCYISLLYFATLLIRSQWVGCTTRQHVDHSPRTKPHRLLQGRACLNQFSLDCVHDSFQAIVCAELLIDVVQVIAERLQADVEVFRDFG